MGDPTPVRGAVIGCGYFSRFHFDAWSRLPGVEIVAACDLDRKKADAYAEEFGIGLVTTEAEEVMSVDGLDFVDIATPPTDRWPLIESAIDRGLAVICQKPLANDFAAAKRILEAAVAADAKFMVHENFRFQPWHREIKRILDAGTIGRVQTITMRSRQGDGWGEDAYLGRQPYFRTMPRLLMHETGVHFADTFRFLAGEIETVDARLRRLNPVIAGEDCGLVEFGFASGAVGVWDADRYHEPFSGDPRYTFGEMLVEADGGSLRLHNDGGIEIKKLGEEPYRHAYDHRREGFAGDCAYSCQEHFLGYLRGEHRAETGPAEYLKSLEVVEAAYRSASSRRPEPVRPSEPEIIDLSLAVAPGMRGVKIAVAKSLESDGWNATTLSLYSHAGTHIDAPRHFLPDGVTLDAADLTASVGPARVVDLTPVEPAESISVERFAAASGPVSSGERLLVRTDWYRRHGTPEYRDALPRISPALARWLVAKQVRLVGVEPPSVADVNALPELTEVHEILFRGGVTIVEGLASLDRIPSDRPFEFIALPLKVTDGDGCPVRAIARLR
ncbi:MAG: cyclase family protein [Planctomycetota bacterium]